MPLNQDDFNRIFILPIAAASFMEMLAEVEDMAEHKDVPLSLKFSNYQRKKMLGGLRLQRENKVDAAAIMKGSAPEDSLSKKCFVQAKGSMKQGVDIMEQHLRDRDFVLSRNVVNQVRTWRDQRAGPNSKRVTLEEFVKDPLGEKQRLANIANLNAALKSEIYENRLSQHRAMGYCVDSGLEPKDEDAPPAETAPDNPFERDQRYQQLFKRE